MKILCIWLATQTKHERLHNRDNDLKLIVATISNDNQLARDDTVLIIKKKCGLKNWMQKYGIWKLWNLDLYIPCFLALQELLEEDIDWWSKFYASLGDYEKCGDYIIQGYDKIMVCAWLTLSYFMGVVITTIRLLLRKLYHLFLRWNCSLLQTYFVIFFGDNAELAFVCLTKGRGFILLLTSKTALHCLFQRILVLKWYCD